MCSLKGWKSILHMNIPKFHLPDPERTLYYSSTYLSLIIRISQQPNLISAKIPNRIFEGVEILMQVSCEKSIRLRDIRFQVRELPISPILQDFIVYYRDPGLPNTRERPVYNEPPPPPRSRIQAILQVFVISFHYYTMQCFIPDCCMYYSC